MAKTSTTGNRDPFLQHLTKAIREYGDVIATDLIKDGQALLEKNMRMQVAAMAIRLSKEALVESHGNELVIRVKFDDTGRYGAGGTG